MRYFLASLIHLITGTPRYFPEIRWSPNLWTHNVFRCIGWFIGERYGIRPSTALLPDGRQIAYTLEAQLALFEAYIRSKVKKLSFKVVRVPQYQLAGLSIGDIQPYRFAIAFDNSLQGTNNNDPVSFITTGSDIAVFANTLTDITANANGNVSAVAYGATTLNINTNNFRYPADRWNIGTCAGGITAGTANIDVTGSTFTNISATSYTGCHATNPDSNNGSDNGGLVTSSLTMSTTVVASNCWLAGSIYGGGTYTAGAGTTRRTNAATSVMDSNATVGTGSQSLVMDQALDFVAANIVSIAPVAAAATTTRTFYLNLLGVGQ